MYLEISIIIPVLNEAENIKHIISYLLMHTKLSQVEIIIVDGGSTDNTVSLANEAGVIVLISPIKGRAAQMNFGAKYAKSNLLYFVHSDTLPPASFLNDIQKALLKGYAFGRFRTKFNSNKKILKLNAFFTRFDLFVCYGGDQSLFIEKKIFTAINGYNETLQIMEDYDIVIRAKKIAKYAIIQKDILISDRKYNTNSWFKVQKANYTIIKMYKKNETQIDMIKKYKDMLNYR